MTTALQTTRPQGAMIAPAAPLSFNEMLQMAQAFAASGFFRDSQDANKCIVKMQYGAELGIGPAASMMGVHVIEGKPAPSSNLMATLIKRSGRYNFRVVVATGLVCELECFENGQSLGKVGFSWEDADRIIDAKGNKLTLKDNWRNYPDDMLFARAVSRAARRHFADVFGGAPVYSAEELGADVTMNAQGEMVVVDAVEVPPAQAPQRTERPPAVPGVQSPASAPTTASQPRVVAPAGNAAAPVPGEMPAPQGDRKTQIRNRVLATVQADPYNWSRPEIVQALQTHARRSLQTANEADADDWAKLEAAIQRLGLEALPSVAAFAALATSGAV